MTVQKAGLVNILPYTQTYSTYHYNNDITKQTTLTNYTHKNIIIQTNHTIVKKENDTEQSRMDWSEQSLRRDVQ